MISNDIPGYEPVFAPNHQEIVPGRFTDCDVRVRHDVTAHTVALASNRWYLSAEGFIERAALPQDLRLPPSGLGSGRALGIAADASSRRTDHGRLPVAR